LSSRLSRRQARAWPGSVRATATPMASRPVATRAGAAILARGPVRVPGHWDHALRTVDTGYPRRNADRQRAQRGRGDALGPSGRRWFVPGRRGRRAWLPGVAVPRAAPGSPPHEAALPAGVAAQYLVADPAFLDLADGLVQDGDSLVYLRLGDDQRRGDFHDIGVDAAVEHHEAELERTVHDFRHLAVSWFLGSPVAHGLQAEHHPNTAHVPDQGVTAGHLAEAVQQVIAGAGGAPDQPPFLDLVQAGQRR